MSITFILLLIGFGQDFFKRQNPLFTKSTISLPQVPLYNVNNFNFSIAFRLEDFELNKFHRPEMFELVSMYQVFKINTETGEKQIEYLEIPLVPCEEDYFPPGFKNKIDGLICPLFNNTLLGGHYTQDTYVLSEVFVKVCIEGEYSLSGVPCSTTEEKIIALEDFIFLAIYTQKSFANPDNYNEGLLPSITSEYFRLNKNLN